MVGEPDDIQVQDLEFDAENVDHIARHGVTPDDVYAVLLNAPRFFRNVDDHAGSHVMLGPDSTGRFFYVALRPLGEGRWRVVTAHRYARRRALRHYKE